MLEVSVPIRSAAKLVINLRRLKWAASQEAVTLP
jgi:hypothetical protein